MRETCTFSTYSVLRAFWSVDTFETAHLKSFLGVGLEDRRWAPCPRAKGSLLHRFHFGLVVDFATLAYCSLERDLIPIFWWTRVQARPCPWSVRIVLKHGTTSPTRRYYAI